jgi:hypothetical protein
MTAGALGVLPTTNDTAKSVLASTLCDRRSTFTQFRYGTGYGTGVESVETTEKVGMRVWPIGDGRNVLLNRETVV